MTNPETPDPLLRIRTVCALTGLSRPTIYLRVKDGSFPPQVSLGPRCVAWRQSEVAAWIRERPVTASNLGH